MAHCYSKNANMSNSLSPIKECLAENMYNDDGMLLSYCHIRKHAAFHCEMTKIKKKKKAHLKNIRISRSAQAACDAMLEKQVEELKGNNVSSMFQKCHAEVFYLFSYTSLYIYSYCYKIIDIF